MFKESAMDYLNFKGVTSITLFCQKYRLKEEAKDDLIIMQGFHQGVALLIGGIVGLAAGYVLFVVL